MSAKKTSSPCHFEWVFGETWREGEKKDRERPLVKTCEATIDEESEREQMVIRIGFDKRKFIKSRPEVALLHSHVFRLYFVLSFLQLQYRKNLHVQIIQY